MTELTKVSACQHRCCHTPSFLFLAFKKHPCALHHGSLWGLAFRLSKFWLKSGASRLLFGINRSIVDSDGRLNDAVGVAENDFLLCNAVLLFFTGRQVWAQVWRCRGRCILSWHTAENWCVIFLIICIDQLLFMRQTHLRGWPRLDEWVPGTFKRTLCLLMEHFLLRCLHFLLSATVCVFPNALHFLLFLLSRQSKPLSSLEELSRSCWSNMARRSSVRECVCVWLRVFQLTWKIWTWLYYELFLTV